MHATSTMPRCLLDSNSCNWRFFASCLAKLLFTRRLDVVRLPCSYVSGSDHTHRWFWNSMPVKVVRLKSYIHKFDNSRVILSTVLSLLILVGNIHPETTAFELDESPQKLHILQHHTSPLMPTQRNRSSVELDGHGPCMRLCTLK